MKSSIHVKLFGLLAEAAGNSFIEIERVNDTDSLREKILSDFPALKNHSFIIAVERQIVGDNTSLKPGDEVVLLPPFAGG